MLELRAADAHVEELCSSRFELCFRLRHIGTRRDSGVEPFLGQLQRLFEDGHVPPQQIRVRIQTVKLEVHLCELCLKRELCVLEVCG